MRTYLVGHIKHARIIGFITSFFVVLFFLSTIQVKSLPLVQLNLDDYSAYPETIQTLLPELVIDHANNKNAFYIVDEGITAEAFDIQATGALESGIAKYWYPQYLATVIIAIDNDQTDVVITSWNDLLTTEVDVGFLNDVNSLHMLVGAMAYGLEGENYSLDKTIRLLSTLNSKKLLTMSSSTSPITICFDYQAVSLNKSGRNLTIIVPSEGTFTFQKGLLSNEQLVFEGNVNEILVKNGFRLIKNQKDTTQYPNDQAYANAKQVIDHEHFNTVAQYTKRLFERRILKRKIFMTIDNQEHLLFALLYLIVITIWTVSVVYRSTQKGIRYAALFTGVILSGWTLVRLVKYQIINMALLARYLWYAYYIFQLSLPLVILWMAWAIDKPKKETFPPKWWRILAGVVSVLIVLVFTNDLHSFVFELDLSRWDWDINYGYGYGYYLILVVSMVNIFLAFVMLVVKSINNPRRKGFIVPLLIFILFGIYNYKYIVRDPYFFETDVTIVTGIFAMLMFESCIRFGLIPVNTKYIELFKLSPLKLQIFNKNKELLLASASAAIPEPNVLNHVLTPSSQPILFKNSLVFSNPIPGGFAVWYDDVTTINQLHFEIEYSTSMLEETNVLLAKKEKFQRLLNEQLVKKELMQQLESELAQSINKLSELVDNLDQHKSEHQDTTRVALLLTYIKRRSNLFFIEQKEEMVDINHLIVSMDELAKVAEYSNVKLAMINEINTKIPSKHAALLYDFFFEVLNQAIKNGCPYMINYLEDNDDVLTMRLLPSQDIGKIIVDSRLSKAINDVQGTILRKEWSTVISMDSRWFHDFW